MKTIAIKVPASTANFGPGFDTLGMALTLYNTMEVTEEGDEIVCEAAGEGADWLARQRDNLFIRAVRKGLEVAGRKMPGLRIRLKNDVPFFRGLGSSSTAVIGGLMAANELSGNTMSRDDLLRLAVEMEGHPDNVTPALVGGLVICMPHDGKTPFIRVAPPKDLIFIAAIPDVRVDTATARRLLPDTIPRADAVYNISRAAYLVASLLQGNTDGLAEAFGDRLHQPYRKHLVPAYEQVCEAALRTGALSVFLSGSGPTLMAVAQGGATEIGEAMVTVWQRHSIGSIYKTLQPDLQGAVVGVR